MERGEQESWALFFETGLPQAYTYLKERQKRRQSGQRGAQTPQEGQSGDRR